MSVSLKIDGLAELMLALQNLPEELKDEATSIVEGQATGAAEEIRSAYGRHRFSGNLADHVVIQKVEGGRYGVKYRVKAASRHAELFELGTQARHTKLGVNRGTMPANPTFIPIMQRRRRRMFQELANLIERHGLKVLDTAA